MENNDKVKWLWATALTGQVVKIPLRDRIDRSYIMQQLLNSGVSVDELEDITYSTVEPKPVPFLRSSLPSRYQVEAGLDQPFPPLPKPSSANTWPSMWSNILMRTYTSLISLKQQGQKFVMSKQDGTKVNILGYNEGNFVDKNQYNEIQSGNVGLLYAVAWKLKVLQKLTDGSTFEDQFTVSYGFSTQTSYSLSTSLGVSYFGMSASLSATFGQVFEVAEKEILRETLSFTGVTGKINVVCVWQLTDLFYLVKKDANGNYVFVDEYKVKIDDKGISEYSADKSFFGNPETQDNGSKIVTNVSAQTSYMQADPTLFTL